MIAKEKVLSENKNAPLPSARGMLIGIVVSKWNDEITNVLYEACHETLIKCQSADEFIIRQDVPGSFELPLGAQFLSEYKNVDAVICLGCVVKGETKHNEYISNAVAVSLNKLSLKYNKPFVFGVLTTENIEQAKERAGGKHGNKGVEAAITAVQMLELKKKLKNGSGK